MKKSQKEMNLCLRILCLQGSVEVAQPTGTVMAVYEQKLTISDGRIWI